MFRILSTPVSSVVYFLFENMILPFSRFFTGFLEEGGIGIFGFAVLAIFYIGFSVFVAKDFGFSVLVVIAVCGFFVF